MSEELSFPDDRQDAGLDPANESTPALEISASEDDMRRMAERERQFAETRMSILTQLGS